VFYRYEISYSVLSHVFGCFQPASCSSSGASCSKDVADSSEEETTDDEEDSDDDDDDDDDEQWNSDDAEKCACLCCYVEIIWWNFILSYL